MTEHFIERCRVCDRVISQCRCPAQDKTVRLGLCDGCGVNVDGRKECPPSERVTFVAEVPLLFFIGKSGPLSVLPGTQLSVEFFSTNKAHVAEALRIWADRIDDKGASR